MYVAVPVLLCLLLFTGWVACATPNMWSTGQPISASMTESPAGTVHAPGTKSYTITATDTDTAFPNYVGPVPDTLTYAWTATKGTISGGANATWTIPADVRGLISCQVVIDDVATMPPGDFGARDDTAITLTRSMTVPYANAQYETFATDNVSGVTKIRYKLSNVGCSCQQLKVEYQEQASSFHTCDWTPILTTGNPAQLISTTTDGDSVVNQVYELSWNTLGLHNADYQLRLKADYNCNCHQTAFRSLEQTHTVNVKNLDITTRNPNGNVDYLRWDPEQSLADTTIQSTLEDHGGTSGTTLNISIYHSDRTANPTPVCTATVTTDSNPVSTYTWDGKDGSGATCAPGIYLFTVNATHNQTGGGDSVSDRASDAFIMEDRMLNVTGQDDKLDFQAKVQGTVANSTIIRIDPQLAVLGSSTGTTPLNSPTPTTTSDWLQVARVDQDGDSSIWVMSGKDGTPENDKSHTARPVLALNDDLPPLSVLGVIGEENFGEPIGYIQAISASAASLYNTFAHDTYQGVSPNRVKLTHAKRPSFGGICNTNTCSISTSWVQQSLEELHRGQIIESLHAMRQNRLFLFAGHSNNLLLMCKQPYCAVTSLSTSRIKNDWGKIAILVGCETARNGGGVSFAHDLASRGWHVIGYKRLLFSDKASAFMDGLRVFLPMSDVPGKYDLPITEPSIRTWVQLANAYAADNCPNSPNDDEQKDLKRGIKPINYFIYIPAGT